MVRDQCRYRVRLNSARLDAQHFSYAAPRSSPQAFTAGAFLLLLFIIYDDDDADDFDDDDDDDDDDDL